MYGPGTCGEACWYAREPVCKCSCNGGAHGMLLVHGAEQPRRNCKIKGHRYILAAVVEPRQGFSTMVQIEVAARMAGFDGTRTYPRAIAWHRKATDSQIARWPELAGHQDGASLVWARADTEAAADAVTAMTRDEFNEVYSVYRTRQRDERRERIVAAA